VACPKKIDAHQRGLQKNNQRKSWPVPYSSSANAMEEGVGVDSGHLITQCLSTLLSSSLPGVPGAPIPTPRSPHLPQLGLAFSHP